MKLLVLLICLLTAANPKDKMEFDKTVHDFGVVSMSDGELNCQFTVRNTGSEPSAIYSVSTNCKCTKITWTRELIAPGKSGVINVTYSNDEGAKPFDKVMLVYLKDQNEAVQLHIRGVVSKKKKD